MNKAMLDMIGEFADMFEKKFSEDKGAKDLLKRSIESETLFNSLRGLGIMEMTAMLITYSRLFDVPLDEFPQHIKDDKFFKILFEKNRKKHKGGDKPPGTGQLKRAERKASKRSSSSSNLDIAELQSQDERFLLSIPAEYIKRKKWTDRKELSISFNERGNIEIAEIK